MQVLRLLLAFAAVMLLVFHSTARAGIETGATQPAADETLIFVLRERRFAGGGGSFWVAVNNQTVDRLANGKYAVVRARAGRITINLANSGIIFASTELDDRPGETVYLKYRVGDLNFREVDETEGREFIENSERTRGIEEPRPNNEEIDVLSNPSRLGFDLTRRASQTINADSGNGVITFFRREDGAAVELGIWSEEDFVSTLATTEGVRLRIPEGNHLFLAGNKGTSILRAEVQADKEYFVWLDYGEGFGGVRLTPISIQKAKQLKRWLEAVLWVEQDSDRITPRIRERGKLINKFMHSQIENPDPRRARINLLGQEHAFDEKILAEREISTSITNRYKQQIANLSRSISADNQDSNFLDISGKYESKMTGDVKKVFGQSKVMVRLTQDGDKFSGILTTGNSSGEIWGEIDGNTIKFDWYTKNGWEGKGHWKITDDVTKLVGKWNSGGTRNYNGQWHLNRIE